MGARIDNRSGFPQSLVRTITQYVLGENRVNSPWVTVRVFLTDHWHHHGHFYAYRRKEEDAFDITIIARLPERVSGEGHDRGLRGGPPPIDPKDWKEAFICILAHEATHVRQFLDGPKTNGYWRTRNGKRSYVGGRIFKEVDAEWAEYLALQRWRERMEP